MQYKKINFRNISCDLILNESGICKQKSLIPRIIIDDKLEANYFHYIYDKNYKTPTKIESYTMCDDIISYTVDAYNKRVDKMVETPIFVWDVTRIN